MGIITKRYGTFLFALVLVMVVVSTGCIGSKYSNELSYGKGTIHYTDDVPKTVAIKVLNYFDDFVEVSSYDLFLETAEGGGYELRVPTVFEGPSDLTEERKKAFDLVASELKEKIGARIVLKVLDTDGNVIYTTVG